MCMFDLKTYNDAWKMENWFDTWDRNIIKYKLMKADDGKYFYRLIVPGYGKDDLTIEQEGSVVTITGATKDPYLTGDVNKFSYKISTDYEVEEAEVKNGVLYIFLKKNSVSGKIPIK